MGTDNRFTATYLQEAEEHLESIEEAALILEEDSDNSEAVDRLFRSMHTIKGSGAMFGFEEVSAFTHHVETALDDVRSGKLKVSKELIDLVLRSKDHIHTMLQASVGGEPAALAEAGQIIGALERLTGNGPVAPVEKKREASSVSDVFRIFFKPHSSIMKVGLDPGSLVEEIFALGDCMVSLHTEDIPEWDSFDPESCHFSWEFHLLTKHSENEIRDVFIFVEGDSEVSIEHLEKLSQDDPIPRVGDILIAKGYLSKKEIDNALSGQRKVGEVLIEAGKVSEDQVTAALNEQSVLKKQRKQTGINSVRVPFERLDHLVNLVGELVITQARLTQISGNMERRELTSQVEEIERLTAEMRDCVLNIRMMPIGSTFSRFKRLVRDLSAELGKKIDLVTVGGETELDKTVIERLGDPLVHILRNSIDHGLESPDERRAAGKNEHGTIRLSAEHKGAHVVVSVADDGKGLDRDVIMEKALAKGLITGSSAMSDTAVFNLVFQPGFSTAKSVTNISGRGVGMDVVKRQIDSLRGSVSIESEKGKGTKVTMTLPLTLAIIDGLLVEVGGGSYIVPVSVVNECMEQPLNLRRNLMPFRGVLIPFIRVRDFFSMSGEVTGVEQTIVVHVEGQNIGIVVDKIIGTHQAVIKSLGKSYRDAEGVSGATIMGDGTVALILDVVHLVSCVRREQDAVLNS